MFGLFQNGRVKQLEKTLSEVKTENELLKAKLESADKEIAFYKEQVLLLTSELERESAVGKRKADEIRRKAARETERREEERRRREEMYVDPMLDDGLHNPLSGAALMYAADDSYAEESTRSEPEYKAPEPTRYEAPRSEPEPVRSEPSRSSWGDSDGGSSRSSWGGDSDGGSSSSSSSSSGSWD